ncbi:3-hydroxybutyryl-CoA dehydrogenase [Clostridium pasteurianum DSM 525 = ATCC 6013]|uniref:L-gulonate 3-dehydrogenase n=1 Tax=Clostridium pasteurianum DSM 525 = ATCC 6013 TaxID=1262449 RepID=A0A0H3J1L1_CLOPA|nr:3-hydroxyacyl-CoA dehydrogenase NAD-binding domain-containing protein [Clostridium pasteurianum]AJA47284.1 3-hydroxybutyryl-CoA dehydrogenase [Clostridium pasteurianum DSM 525 = ATCC 6013]AJA51272.1 3-hydroxybutyryl-CoA dehydrogenase [Clostridium pasteurianum DSM 525 = ATCC 6013]ELP57517.1 3-hydroxyacyl-CoA dehydrogenase [Clostridium pasteurianum DSM 525 = ATCC 6013]KRU12720.1 3-hydroxyacyl-CoA dehydrogenase [Clostridium pasteurianum DSM 525 = ATCC 6013]
MKEKTFKKIVIAGAGLMGASIAQIFPQYGYETTIYSNREQDFQRAKEIIANCQNTLIENNIIADKLSQEVQKSIIYTTDLETAFKEADLIIEAIPEVFEIKVDFFRKISDIIPEDSIVATNTSAISINDLAENISNPQRFCGTHWLNPPHIIPLVEIVKSNNTAELVVDSLLTLMKSINKKPVVLKKDIKGFLSNRLQFALLREAAYLVENDVATPEDIDNTLKYGNGIRYACSGPFKIVDLGGIEVFNNVAKYLFPVLSKETEVCKLLNEMAEKDYNGISNGQGFYQYTEESALKEEEQRDKKMIKILEF